MVHIIKTQRPDLIVMDRENKKFQIINFAVPFDTRVESKEIEKIEKYYYLARELKKL